MSRDNAGYVHYITTLHTVGHGMIRSNPDQDLHQLVAAHYGPECGYLPWKDDGYCGVIVKPAETTVVREEYMPVAIRTEQQIVDWVMGMDQRTAGPNDD